MLQDYTQAPQWGSQCTYTPRIRERERESSQWSISAQKNYSFFYLRLKTLTRHPLSGNEMIEYCYCKTRPLKILTVCSRDTWTGRESGGVSLRGRWWRVRPQEAAFTQQPGFTCTLHRGESGGNGILHHFVENTTLVSLCRGIHLLYMFLLILIFHQWKLTSSTGTILTEGSSHDVSWHGIIPDAQTRYL